MFILCIEGIIKENESNVSRDCLGARVHPHETMLMSYILCECILFNLKKVVGEPYGVLLLTSCLQ